jgi:uncharacterized protein
VRLAELAGAMMLIEFSVKNYRSIRDKVTLSMVASSEKDLPENTFEVTEPAKMTLLKSAAIYGANASGKSNLVRAMSLLRDLVTESAIGRRPDPETDAVPFRLDPATRTAPSEFEVSFIAGGERYVYGVALDSQRVHEEWLTAARGARSRALFHRHSDGSVDWGNSWRGERERVREATRDDALLVSVAAQFRCAGAEAVRERMACTLALPSDEPFRTSIRRICVMFENLPESRQWLLRLLGAADTGIEDVEVHDPGHATRPGPEGAWSARGEVAHWATTTRRDSAGAPVSFSMGADESAGTSRLFASAFHWFAALDAGWCLFIDEFESKLHPLITRKLLELVHTSPKNPQVIFTTHDSGLLDSSILRRDQVWFTEKNRDGATDLYSLWQFRPRNDHDIPKRYLQGRYGAIPFVGEFSFGEDTEA